MLSHRTSRRLTPWLLPLALIGGATVTRSARSEPAVDDATSVTPPRPLDLPTLTVPEDVEGDHEVDVTLTITVDVDGQVSAVSVTEVTPSDAPAGFRREAEAYVRALRFEPARAGDTPVAVEFPFRLRFDASTPRASADPRQPPPPRAVTYDDDPPEVVPPSEGAVEEPEPSPTEPVEAELEVPDEEPLDIEVVGERQTRAPVAASDFDIDIGQLRRVPRRGAEDYLTLAPGIMLNNHGGVGHPSSIFLRGFNAQEGQDIEFVVDGVPINEISNAHGHGFADTNFIIPELIDRLHVLEGPFDPSQGDFAVAGSARYHLGLRERGIRVHGAYGSFNHRRAMLLWGPAGQETGTYAGADFTAGDGFGINRAYRSGRVNGGYEHNFGRGTRLRTSAHAYGTRFAGAGLVREDDVDARRVHEVGGVSCGLGLDAQRQCSYDPNQGGALFRAGGVVELSSRRSNRVVHQNLFVSRRTMRMRENFTGYVTDPPSRVRPEGDQRGDGVEQVYAVTTAGARGAYETGTRWWNRPQDLTLGWHFRFDGGDTAQRRLRRSDGTAYRVDFDNRINVVNLGTHLGGTVRPHDRVDLNVGARVDGFVFAVRDDTPRPDRLGVPRDSQVHREAFGVSAQPRTSLVVQATSWLDWLAAYGIGTRSSDATGLSDGEFAAFARVQAAETGFRVITPRLGQLDIESRVVGFYTHVDRDLVFDPIAGRNLFQGTSHRFGTLATLRLQVPQWFDWLSSFTWTEAFCSPDPGNQLPQNACGTETRDISRLGRRLPFIPRYVLRSDAVVYHDVYIKNQPFTWSVGTGLSYTSRRPLPENRFGTRIVLLDAAANLRWRWIEAGVQMTNMLNLRWNAAEFFYASNFEDPGGVGPRLPVTHFAAGAPFQALGTLTLYFEPDGPRRERRRRSRG
jgi:iron complex outermembrane recepter protein